MLLLDQDIPDYIRSSPYLKSLLENGPFPEEGIEVPDGCVKEDMTVNAESDLRELLCTLRFWILPQCTDPPLSLLRYALDPKHKDEMAQIYAEFRQDFSFLTTVILIKKIPASPADQLEIAVLYGTFSIVRYLCEEAGADIDTALPVAAKYGRVEYLEYFRSRGHVLTTELATAASGAGQLATLVYLHANGVPLSLETARCAVLHGQLECLKYSLDHSSEPMNSDELAKPLIYTAGKGCMACLEYLWTRFADLRDIRHEWYVLVSAAEMGRKCVMEFARDEDFASLQDVELSAELFASTMRKGHAACVEFLYSLGLTATAADLRVATVQGHVQCVKFLLEHNCPAPHNLCSLCVEHNHLQLLQVLLQVGQPSDAVTCDVAATKGNLECLRYLHEHGCPLDAAHIATNAARAPTIECLQYVVEQGAQLSVETARAAVQHKSLTALHYLHSVHCLWDATVCEEAAAAGSLECLRFLHECGCPWDERTSTAAARAWRIDCLKYTQQHGCPTALASHLAPVFGSVSVSK